MIVLILFLERSEIFLRYSPVAEKGDPTKSLEGHGGRRNKTIYPLLTSDIRNHCFSPLLWLTLFIYVVLLKFWPAL